MLDAKPRPADTETREVDELPVRRAGIFYYSTNPGAGRHPITLCDGGVIFVRIYEHLNVTLLDALERATPDADESVMNTHELPERIR